MTNIVPVLLAGGLGTRLWPLSREIYPKQLMNLAGDGSLLQQAARRALDCAAAGDVITVTTEAHYLPVRDQLSEVDAAFADNILLEPEGRNTAAAIAVAALHAAARGDDPTLFVAPADHVLRDTAALADAVRLAARAEAHLCTFGIAPDRAETGYGYIELEGPGLDGAQPFVRFVEKPDAQAAEEMVAAERFLWNSGMFVFGVRAILAAFAEHAAEVDKACEAAIAAGKEDLFFFRLDGAAYGASPDISIDYAIMEHVKGTVVPVDCGWNDLGSWSTVWQEMARDETGTAAGANTVAIECRGSLLRSDHRDIQLVGIGLEGIAAIATRDAVLVADMARTQDVRLAVEALKARGAAQATDFPRCYRPWGWYETLALGERFQVKQIMVKPGGQLSLQSHVHRSEHWVVVAGSAQVTVGETVELLSENQSVYIPLGAVHRLENPGKVDLHLIEVQSGAYLGEDDIVRYEDVYARG